MNFLIKYIFLLAVIMVAGCGVNETAEFHLKFTGAPLSGFTFSDVVEVEKGGRNISASTYQVVGEYGVKSAASFSESGKLILSVECAKDDVVEKKDFELEFGQSRSYEFRSGVIVNVISTKSKS